MANTFNHNGKLFIDSNGKVGIGQTDLSSDVGLYVKKAAGTVIKSETTGTNANPDVLIIDADNNNARASLQIQGNGGSVESLWVSSTGNVGIGTTSPAQKLHIVGGQVRLDSNAGGYYQYNTSNGFRSAFYDNGTVTSIFGDGDGSNPAITINSGNVGIGTTSPVTILEVKDSSSNPSISITGPNTGTSTLNLGDTDDINIQRIIGDHSNNSMQFHTANAEKMRLDSNGNLGIGTTSPGAKLEVLENGGAIIRLHDPGDNSWRLKGDVNFHIYDDSNSDYLTILNSGNVGIGITSPTAPLDVNGVRAGRSWHINNRAGIRLDSNGTSYPSDLLFGHTAAANQVSWAGVYWSLSSRAASADNKFYFYRGAGNPTGSSESILITLDPNLRVGIGTTSPSEKLHVQGSAKISDSVIVGEGTGTNPSSSIILKAYDGDVGTNGNNVIIKTPAIFGAGTRIFELPDIGASSTKKLPFWNSGGTTNNAVLTNSANNYGIDGESNLTYNGTDLSITNGNVNVSSGYGIDFSATSNASTGSSGTLGSEVLDDYEEGTWTPQWISTGFNSVTMDVVNANYTKIGNTVFLTAYVRTNFVDVSSAAASTEMSGLPFTPVAGDYFAISVPWSDSWDDEPTGGYIVNDGSSSRLYFHYRDASDGPTIGLKAGDFIDGTAQNRIMFSAIYITS